MASIGKQLRNRVPNQTSLHRCAGVRARGKNNGCTNIVQAEYRDEENCVAFTLILGSHSAI